jgi:Sulfotransferase domain
MSTSTLPRMDRRVPKWGVRLVSVIFYGVFVPLNWLLKKLGRESALVTMMNPGARKPGHFKTIFAHYEPTSSDVFVSTFAKSGTNWMMQIAHQIAFRGAGDYEHIHDVISWPDLGARARRMAVSLDDRRVQEASPTKLRVIKTHLSAYNVPLSDQARYLVVVRDPKEIFVSSYHFASGAAGPLMPTSDVWLELFLTPKFPLNFGSTWAEHTASYWALKDKPNVLVLSFSDMKRDLPGAVQRVADVLGVRLTSEEMNAVLEKSTFSYMSGIENKFTPIPKGTLPWGEGLKMMREGKAGNSHEMLTPEQRTRIDEHFQAELARLGSDFPYAELFGTAPSRRLTGFDLDDHGAPPDLRPVA